MSSHVFCRDMSNLPSYLHRPKVAVVQQQSPCLPTNNSLLSVGWNHSSSRQLKSGQVCPSSCSKFCQQCGGRFTKEARFCASCGNNRRKESVCTSSELKSFSTVAMHVPCRVHQNEAWSHYLQTNCLAQICENYSQIRVPLTSTYRKAALNFYFSHDLFLFPSPNLSIMYCIAPTDGISVWMFFLLLLFRSKLFGGQ